MSESRCPMCGRENPEGAEACQFCGARIKPLQIGPSPSSESVEPERPIEDTQPPTSQIGSGTPDWLQRIRSQVDQGAEQPEEGEEDSIQADTADWLGRLRDTDKTVELESTPVTDEEPPEATPDIEETSPAPSMIPDWLSRIRAREALERSQAEEEQPQSDDWITRLRKDTPYDDQAEMLEDEQTEAWLERVVDRDSDESQPLEADEILGVDETAPSSLEPEDDATSSWLDSIRSEAIRVEPPAESSMSSEDREVPEPPEADKLESIPDWLDELIPPGLSDEAWLSEDKLEGEEALQDADLEPGMESAPSWLAGMTEIFEQPSETMGEIQSLDEEEEEEEAGLEPDDSWLDHIAEQAASETDFWEDLERELGDGIELPGPDERTVPSAPWLGEIADQISTARIEQGVASQTPEAGEDITPVEEDEELEASWLEEIASQAESDLKRLKELESQLETQSLEAEDVDEKEDSSQKTWLEAIADGSLPELDLLTTDVQEDQELPEMDELTGPTTEVLWSTERRTTPPEEGQTTPSDVESIRDETSLSEKISPASEFPEEYQIEADDGQIDEYTTPIEPFFPSTFQGGEVSQSLESALESASLKTEGEPEESPGATAPRSPSERSELPQSVEDKVEEPNWIKDLSAISDEGLPQVPALILEDGTKLSGEDLQEGTLDPELLPEWLNEFRAAVREEEELSQDREEPSDNLAPAALPSWLEALRPIETFRPQEEDEIEEIEDVEVAGPLAGLQGVISAEPVMAMPRTPSVGAVRLDVTEHQYAQAELLHRMVQEEALEFPGEQRKKTGFFLVRWILSAILVAAVALPVFLGVPKFTIPINGPRELNVLIGTVESLLSNRPALIVFDYSPAYSAELDTVAGSLLGHLMSRSISVVTISTRPTGPPLADRLMTRLAAHYAYINGDDYLHLGYVPGGQTAIQLLASAPRSIAIGGFRSPEGLQDISSWDLPLLEGIYQLSDFGMVAVITDTPENARTWAEQVSPRLADTPLVMVLTAGADPLIRPYYEAQPPQVQGILSGLSAASAYEQWSKLENEAQKRWNAYGAGMLAVELILISALGYRFMASLFGKAFRKFGGERAS